MRTRTIHGHGDLLDTIDDVLEALRAVAERRQAIAPDVAADLYRDLAQERDRLVKVVGV